MGSCSAYIYTPCSAVQDGSGLTHARHRHATAARPMHSLTPPPDDQDTSRMAPLTWAAFCSSSHALAGRGRASARGGPPTSASPLGPNACNTLQSAKRKAHVKCLHSMCSHPAQYESEAWPNPTQASAQGGPVNPTTTVPNLLEGGGCAANCNCCLQQRAVARRRAGLSPGLQVDEEQQCVELHPSRPCQHQERCACAFQHFPNPTHLCRAHSQRVLAQAWGRHCEVACCGQAAQHESKLVTVHGG